MLFQSNSFFSQQKLFRILCSTVNIGKREFKSKCEHLLTVIGETSLVSGSLRSRKRERKKYESAREV
jgi:hypothetical protein